MTTNKIEQIAILRQKERLNERFWYLTFECPAIAETARPGQFVNVETGKYLRRPLAVAEVSGGNFTVGIEVKGDGTKMLAELSLGSEVNVLGPLGHGFHLDGVEQIVVVGGGTGIFPLVFALEEAKRLGLQTAGCFGFRSEKESFWGDVLPKLADQSVLTSDEGDLGIKGTVMAGLPELVYAKSTRILCVGPKPMMQAVSSWAEERLIPCEVSIEEHMACGIGLCLTCVCKVREGDLDGSAEGMSEKNVRSCLEGPVFDSRRIIWR